jgi:hypothetical protein
MQRQTTKSFTAAGLAALVGLFLGQEPVSAGGAGEGLNAGPPLMTTCPDNQVWSDTYNACISKKTFKRYKADDPNNPVTGIEAQAKAKAKAQDAMKKELKEQQLREEQERMRMIDDDPAAGKQQEKAAEGEAGAAGIAGAMKDNRPPSETSKTPCGADDALDILMPEKKVIDTLAGSC